MLLVLHQISSWLWTNQTVADLFFRLSSRPVLSLALQNLISLWSDIGITFICHISLFCIENSLNSIDFVFQGDDNWFGFFTAETEGIDRRQAATSFSTFFGSQPSTQAFLSGKTQTRGRTIIWKGRQILGSVILNFSLIETGRTLIEFWWLGTSTKGPDSLPPYPSPLFPALPPPPSLCAFACVCLSVSP